MEFPSRESMRRIRSAATLYGVTNGYCKASMFQNTSLARNDLERIFLYRRRTGIGFSFTDGEQVLVSLQKPMGIVLEQEEGPITVTDVSPGGAADGAGVEVGDILLAVQNASVEEADLEEVLAFIGKAPRVVNLRFLRSEQ